MINVASNMLLSVMAVNQLLNSVVCEVETYISNGSTE